MLLNRVVRVLHVVNFIWDGERSRCYIADGRHVLCDLLVQLCPMFSPRPAADSPIVRLPHSLLP
jgi:hypothetical protein